MPTYAPARLLAVKEIPSGEGWLYEPKLDGYRGLLVSNSRGAGSVSSRNAKDLGRFFPELIELAARLPANTVTDGEIVRPIESGVSFIQLQRRLALPNKERDRIALEAPVAFVAFDLLRTDVTTLAPIASASAGATCSDWSIGQLINVAADHPDRRSGCRGELARSLCLDVRY